MDEKVRVDKPNPILKANVLSRLFMCWISPLLTLGYKRPLENNDLADPVNYEKSKYLTDRLETEWNKELIKPKFGKKPSLLLAIVRAYGPRILLNSILLFIEEMLQVIQPLLVAHLQGYFDNKIDLQEALIVGSAISFIVTLIWFVHHPYSQNIARYGMRVRIACCGLVYRKALRMTTNTLDSKTSGRMLNLLSNDATRIDNVLLYLPYLVIAPIQLACIVFLLIKKVNITYLAGLLVFLLYIPIQGSTAKIFNHFRTKAASKTDERINLLSEILNGVRIIKMYCWEMPFKSIIKKLRGLEIRYQAYLHSISAINSLFENDLPCFITFISVAVFINYNMDVPLLPSYLVFAMGYYTKLCTTLGFYLSRSITMTMGALVSLNRFEEFLLAPESKSNEKVVNIDKAVQDEAASIKVEKLSVSWTKSFDGFYLSNITFDVKSNQLVAVVGPTGSGKSSLLMALLGEIETIEGRMDVRGSVFFVSQEPWIFTATLKQNILFGKPFDQQKFDEVLRACCLDKDLLMLPEAENTMIGEKGINLSGGQRARVSLARALYYDAQIYLFDDPLSAVDTNVSKFLFDNCISEYLKSKIRILVTHQVHHLERADQILIFKDGDLEAKGTFQELNEQGFNLNSLLNTNDQAANPSSPTTTAPAVFKFPQPATAVVTDNMALALSKKSLVNEKKLISEIKRANKGEKDENKKLLKEKKLAKRTKKLWRLIKRNQKEKTPEGYEEVKLHKRKSKNENEEEGDNESKSSSKEKSSSKDRSESESDDDDEESSDEDESESSSSEDESEESSDDEAANNVQHDEKQTLGKISWKVYADYFRSGGGIIGGIFVFLLFIFTQLFVLAADYWVSEWATIEASPVSRNASLDGLDQIVDSNLTFANQSTLQPFNEQADFQQTRNYHFIRYSILVGSSLILITVRSVMFFFMCVRTSYKFHKFMLDSIMSAPMRFFDFNPLGRIMNRFSTDIGIIDDQIPQMMFDFLQISMIVLGSFGLAVYINYWIVIPTIPLLGVFIYLRNYFVSSSRELKRIEGICRSPIFVHANSSLTGLATIRASKNGEKFCREFETHYDQHTRAYFAFICTQRWFSIRLDFIVCLYICFAVFSSIVAKESLGLKSGEIGLLLVYLFQLSNLFYWSIKTSCEVENLMTSVERVAEYTSIKPEPLDKGSRKPPKDWPKNGRIEFTGVSFSYDPKLPNVLNDFSLVINPGEKVGVVGRTGAGKSSLFQTLFRMAEPNGQVLIDDLDIKEISLHDLRSKIAIIPQEPTLFLGTVRSNLDPFHKKNDHSLWDALERVQLKEAVQDMPGGLDAVIEKGGVNLSVGQKQLICLARAILKKSKILIIDEATANVDYKTDELVQKAIRECFSDCTVLTIAHRLQTIMDCDRIMCLNEGRLENFDTPLNLLSDKATLFFKLASMLGKKETDKLLQIAKKKKSN